MKRVFKFLSVILVISVLPTAAQALAPSNMEISQWIENEDVDKRNIQIEKVYPVILVDGEEAYLAAVRYANAGVHLWGGYILVRPKRAAARVLEGFGGQTNKVVPFGEPSSIVVISEVASGGGTSERSHSVVAFDGWNVKTLYAVEDAENSGDCGYEDRPCEGSSHYFNFTHTGIAPGKVGLVVTEIRYSSAVADDPNPLIKTMVDIIALDLPR